MYKYTMLVAWLLALQGATTAGFEISFGRDCAGGSSCVVCMKVACCDYSSVCVCTSLYTIRTPKKSRDAPERAVLACLPLPLARLVGRGGLDAQYIPPPPHFNVYSIPISHLAE